MQNTTSNKTANTGVSNTHKRDKAACRYLAGIRNPFKRTYGVKYWEWLNGKADFYPEYEGISYLAAQAVRMRLADIKVGII